MTVHEPRSKMFDDIALQWKNSLSEAANMKPIFKGLADVFSALNHLGMLPICGGSRL